MASSSRRKSASSGSSRPAAGPRRVPMPRSSSRPAPASRGGAPSRRASGPAPRASRPAPRPAPTARPGRAPAGRGVSSVRLGDADRLDRQQRMQQAARRSFRRVAVAVAVVIALIVGAGALYLSPAFTIEKVDVVGAEHLTSQDMAALASIPQGTTLLTVDPGAIERSIDRDAWVKDVTVNRVFPSTLQIIVTEREIAAVVEVAADDAATIQPWAIASDGMWLMPIPDRDSELGQAIAPQIYEDADAVLSISGVPYGLVPEIGSYCTDVNVNNALAIVDGMTTDLADQVKKVSATDAESTTLTLDNGIEIAFGTAENIREKERICLKIMEENPGKVAYINVRVVDRPTWRAV